MALRNTAGARVSTGRELVPVGKPGELVASAGELPDIVRRAGAAANFAAERIFRRHHQQRTYRRAYRLAVNRFLEWAEARWLELARIAPRDVGQYMAGLGKKTSIATRKQHLAALRHFDLAPFEAKLIVTVEIGGLIVKADTALLLDLGLW